MAEPPLLVVGMHRSGTSMVGGMLSAAGVSLGEELIPADGANARGYFEDAAVVDFHGRLFRHLSSLFVRLELRYGIFLNFLSFPLKILFDCLNLLLLQLKFLLSRLDLLLLSFDLLLLVVDLALLFSLCLLNIPLVISRLFLHVDLHLRPLCNLFM